MARNRILIIGPSGAGKTILLGALRRAATRSQRGLEPHLCQIHHANAALLKLWDRVERQVTLTGQPQLGVDATMATEKYEFELVVDDRHLYADTWWKRMLTWLRARLPAAWRDKLPGMRGGRSGRFTMIDGPGGALLPAESVGLDEDADGGLRQYREELIAYARTCDGLLVCIDPNDADSSSRFFLNLPRLLEEISPADLPFRRIVILLTKADKYFAGERRNALAEAESGGAWPVVYRMLRVGLEQILFKIGEDAGVLLATGFASAYGFVPGEGSSNYDPELDGLRENQEALDCWCPYRILDSLVYLTTGVADRMSVRDKQQLRRELHGDRTGAVMYNQGGEAF